MDVRTGLRLAVGASVFGALVALSSCGGGGGGGASTTAHALLAAGPSVSVTSSTVFRSTLGPGENEWVRDAITTDADFQGEVKFELYNSGQPVASKTFANVSIAARATQVIEFNYTLPPALPDGRYTSLLTVTDSTGQVLLSQQPGAYFDVAACQTQACVVNPVLSAYPLTPGELESMQVTLKATSAISNAQAEMRVLNADGTIVASKAINPLSLSAGSSMPLQFDWQTPTALPLGTYRFVVGVWDQNWTSYGYFTLLSFDAVTASPAPVPRTNFSAEAELGTLAGTGVSVQQEPTANNGAYVGNFSPSGTSGTVTMAIPNVAQGTYDVAIRFRNFGTQQNYVQVNGGPVQDWPFTSQNNDWNEVVVPRQLLVEGTNTFTISKDWGYTDIDSIRISASSPSGDTGAGSYPPITLSTPQNSQYGNENVLQTGPSGYRYWIEDNPWGVGNFTRGTYGGLSGSTYETQYGIAPVDATGNIAWRNSWKWPQGGNEVKAYPGSIFGDKPGWFVPNCPCPNGSAIIQQENGQPLSTIPIGPTPGTFLPLQIGAGLPTINTSFAFHHLITPPANTSDGLPNPDGQGHVTFDIWLQNTATQEHGADTGYVVTHEIMIPVNYWGNYGLWSKRPSDWVSYCQGITPPAGVDPCVFTYNGIRFHVLHGEPHSSSWAQYWAFTVFEPEQPLSEDTIRTFDVSAFVNFLRNLNKPGTSTPLVPPTDYLVDIEFGVEPIYGVGDTEVWNYRVWKP